MNRMRAIEVTGSIDEQGQLSLDQPLQTTNVRRVRVIVLLPETIEEVEENDLDDTSIDEIKGSLRKALQEAKAGQRIPLLQMWEDIDAE